MLAAMMDALSYFFTGLKVKPLADGQHNKDLYTHPIWTAVKCGDLATVDQIVKEDLELMKERAIADARTTSSPSRTTRRRPTPESHPDDCDPARPACLMLRGDVGETPIHWCFLYYRREQREIAQCLLSQYPTLAATIYTGAMYYGETILHMAIVHRDLEMVRFLVGVRPELIHTRATGGFFKPGSPCYYGEQPLCFAACTDQRDVVDFLMKHGAALDAADEQGNFLFHLLVLHDLPDMYDYIEELWGTKHPDRDPSLLLNKDLLSPLTYAASLGCKGMFEHLLLKKDTIMEWHFGPTSLSLHPLDEVDYIPNAQPGQKTAIQLLLDKAHVELLFIPRVHVIIMQKWVNFAHRIFFYRLAFIIVYFFVFTATVVFTDTPMSPIQRWCFQGAHAVVLLVAAVLLQSKLRQLWAKGVWVFFTAKGSAFLENVFPLTFSVCICVVYGLRLTTAKDLIPPEDVRLRIEAPLLALAALFGWCYNFIFFLGFRLTGPFVVMIWSMLVGDVLRFFSIYSIFLMAFSTAFHVLWGHQGVEEYGRQLHANFLMMVGDFEPFYSRFISSEHRQLTVFFMVFYIVLVSILLVNLLIAMMGSTFSSISEASDRRWFLEWARIICSLESELSPETRAQYFEEREVNGAKMRFIRVYDGSKSYSEDWGDSFKFQRQQSQFAHSRSDWDPLMSPASYRLRRSMLAADMRNASVNNLLAPTRDYSTPPRSSSPARLPPKSRSDCFLGAFDPIRQSVEQRPLGLSVSIPSFTRSESKPRSRKVSSSSLCAEGPPSAAADERSNSDRGGNLSPTPIAMWQELDSPMLAVEPPALADINGLRHPRESARMLEKEVQQDTLLLLKDALQKVEQAAALARTLLHGTTKDSKPAMNGLTAKLCPKGGLSPAASPRAKQVQHSADHQRLVGTANVWLYSLAHMLEFKCEVAVISPDGEPEGKLSAALLPCDAKGGVGPWDDDPTLDPYVEDPTSLLGTAIRFQLHVAAVTLSPPPKGTARPSLPGALKCRYKWDAQDPSESWTETTVVELQSLQATFDFNKGHTVPVDAAVLQRLQGGCLQIEVWGLQLSEASIPTTKSSDHLSAHFSGGVSEHCCILEDLEERLAAQRKCLSALLS